MAQHRYGFGNARKRDDRRIHTLSELQVLGILSSPFGLSCPIGIPSRLGDILQPQVPGLRPLSRKRRSHFATA